MDEKIYTYMNFIYECKICQQRFPIWYVSKEEWKQSRFRKGTICNGHIAYHLSVWAQLSSCAWLSSRKKWRLRRQT